MFEHEDAISALIDDVDAAHARACRAQRELLGLIAEVDRSEAWRDSGARDTAHWLGMRYGISYWKAHRWIAAAHALEGLPRLSDALARGELGIDKVVELSRFASPKTEAGLIGWAKGVSCGAIRHRGDLAARTPIEEVSEVVRDRVVSWWYFDEGRRFGLGAELPGRPGSDRGPGARARGPGGSGDARRAGPVLRIGPARRRSRGAVLGSDRTRRRPRPRERGHPRSWRVLRQERAAARWRAAR